MNGIEWLVEAHGCDPQLLSSIDTLQALFARMVRELDLHPCGQAQWQQFPQSGGITGLCLLSESHLACHTFPEYGSLCLNLFCCRERAEWDFECGLREAVGAQRVTVRRAERPYMTRAAALEAPSLSGAVATLD